jgi:LmbE family N-acetylglucosaminyl deacetylase
MRVLAVVAHPDDIDILCAGTMARYAKDGAVVYLCNATSGDRGSVELSMDEIRAVREEEAKRSAAVIGAEYRCLEFHDGDLLTDDLSARERFVDLFREAKPDVVFTHHPDDYHADHQATSRLVFDASFLATVPLLKSTHPAFDHVIPIYHIDTMAGIGFEPQEYVDISDVFNLKREMLSQHTSQVTWMKEHDDLDTIDFMETMSRFRGIQCGVRYAEAFSRRQVWLRNPPVRLLP